MVSGNVLLLSIDFDLTLDLFSIKPVCYEIKESNNCRICSNIRMQS